MFCTTQKMDRCVFQNIGGTCDKRVLFGCFCTKHMRLMFGMDCVEDTIVTKRYTKTILKQVFTLPTNNIILPFPYKITEDGKFCLLRSEANDIISQYVSQLPIQDDASGQVRKRIAALWLSFCMSGYFVTENIGGSAGLFQDYIKSAQAYYDSKFNNCFIDIYGLGQPASGALNDFPIIYKILLQYVEFSTIKRREDVNPNNADQEMRTFQPNLILDLEKRAFVIVNDTNSETVCYKTDKGTFASPIIIAGTRQSNSLVPFESSHYINISPIEGIPNLCDGNNKIIKLNFIKN